MSVRAIFPSVSQYLKIQKRPTQIRRPSHAGILEITGFSRTAKRRMQTIKKSSTPHQISVPVKPMFGKRIMEMKFKAKAKTASFNPRFKLLCESLQQIPQIKRNMQDTYG